MAIDHQEFGHSYEGGSFIALLECMCLSNTSEQSYRERDDILFTMRKCVCGRAKALSSSPGSRTKWRSPVIATTVRLILTTASIGSHLGSFGKSRQDLGKTCDYLVGQHLVVDIALQRPCPQDLARITPPPL
jgi:hypothetical protein